MLILNKFYNIEIYFILYYNLSKYFKYINKYSQKNKEYLIDMYVPYVLYVSIYTEKDALALKKVHEEISVSKFLYFSFLDVKLS